MTDASGGWWWGQTHSCQEEPTVWSQLQASTQPSRSEADIKTSWERDWLESLAGRSTLPPSLHPPVASLYAPAPAPLAPAGTDAWLEGPNRDREILSGCAHGPQVLAGPSRPPQNIWFRDAELEPSLLGDRFPCLPATFPMALFGFTVTAPACQITFMTQDQILSPSL